MSGSKAILLSPRDNVATAMADLRKGAKVEVSAGEKTVTVELKTAISFGHKFSLCHIGIGSPIIKYGEVIGTATKSIEPGQHVHVHNVGSTRGRGDLSKDEA